MLFEWVPVIHGLKKIPMYSLIFTASSSEVQRPNPDPGGYKEMSSILTDQPVAPSNMSPNAGVGGGGCVVPANEYSCAHGAQINLWRSNSIFNLIPSTEICVIHSVIGQLRTGYIDPSILWLDSEPLTAPAPISQETSYEESRIQTDKGKQLPNSLNSFFFLVINFCVFYGVIVRYGSTTRLIDYPWGFFRVWDPDQKGHGEITTRTESNGHQ